MTIKGYVMPLLVSIASNNATRSLHSSPVTCSSPTGVPGSPPSGSPGFEGLAFPSAVARSSFVQGRSQR